MNPGALSMPAKKPSKTRRTKRIMLVEDHPMTRLGMVRLLSDESDMTICCEAPDAYHALDAIPSTKPDLVLVDITLPGKGGLDLIKDLRATHPDVSVLVVSMHDES